MTKASRRFGSQRVADAALLGTIALLVSVAFSWVPSVWFDEAATITSATRSWSDLAHLLESVDLVHGLYYAGMHVWFDIVPYSPFTLRLPSAIFTGLAAGMLTFLTSSITNRRTAVLAGLAFTLLPRVTWSGAEGRSFALGTALAVLMTLVFVAAWRRGRERRRIRTLWWAVYGVLAVLGTGVFLYLALLVVAHGVTAAWTRLAQADSAIEGPGSRTASAGLLGWLGASVAAAVILVPFVLTVSGQSQQVSWIPPITAQTLNDIVVWQWFALNPAFAVAGWALVLTGGTVLVRRSRRTPVIPEAPLAPSLLAIAVPWIVVPTLGLIVASLLVSPLYSPRYLTFGAPAVALLMGVALASIRRNWLTVVAVAALVALAAPQYVAQRMPEAKQNSSWHEVATLVATERAKHPVEKSAVIFGPVRQHPAATTRIISLSYPEAFAGMVDVKLKTPAAEAGTLWEKQYPIAEVTNRFDGVDEVWLVTSDKQDWRPSITAKLGALGYDLDTEWNLTGVNVLRYER
ncbi:glycosyltransferase family 39 protein [Cryobacterium roopkundense]|uniref:Mannosyltransferase n=1 Tax=Cryobacterium roopkundense TaxID=1001240 RepID=A0A7W8ZXR2_9MICO|nr:hypothetical protein [Cryobacterium roopkundense]MBB5642106.1 mannosyltransferase [Cryobacterium roopkundense]